MDEKPKRKTTTSVEVRQRYIDKTYSMISARFPKQLVLDFKKACADRGVSQASVIQKAIEEFLKTGD